MLQALQRTESERTEMGESPRRSRHLAVSCHGMPKEALLFINLSHK